MAHPHEGVLEQLLRTRSPKAALLALAEVPEAREAALECLEVHLSTRLAEAAKQAAESRKLQEQEEESPSVVSPPSSDDWEELEATEVTALTSSGTAMKEEEGAGEEVSLASRGGG